MFANALPALMRALFVTDGDIHEPKMQFCDESTMVEEVRTLRENHNFSPSTAIKDVAMALRKNMNEADLEAVLEQLPAGAREFWAVV